MPQVGATGTKVDIDRMRKDNNLLLSSTAGQQILHCSWLEREYSGHALLNVV
jgi:hypothetical protein